jgi:predicted permease
LAAVEVALAVILLIGAGLLVRTFRSLLAVDPGFRAEHVLRARIKLPGRYDLPRAAAFCRELLDRETALPGVVSASLASGVPMSDLQMSGFRVDGAAEPKPGSEPVADVRSISETYFETLGMRLLRGRSFTRTEAESSNATAIVVNQVLAAQFWFGQDAIGKSVTMDRGYGERRQRTIVGVVYDTRQLALGTATRPEIFFPSREFMEMSLVVKTAGDPLAMTDAVSRQVWAIDRDQPVYDLAAMRNIVQGSAAQERFNMSILSALSGLSLALAVVGLYGILAYGVSLRTRELGVRLALGAEPRAIIRLVLGEGLRVAVVGSAIGVAASLALSHLVSGLLYGVTTTDPLTFITMPLLVIALALAASYSPARRASRIDPMESLRQ